LTFA